MRGISNGGARLLLVLTIMSAMLLAAAVPSMAQTRRSARVVQSDIIDNIGSARAESGRNVTRGNIGNNTQNAVQDSLTDNLGDDGTQDGIAENDALQEYEGIGDALAESGPADALGNDSGTSIVQEAENLGDSIDDDDDDSEGDGAANSVDQEAIVTNFGDGEAVSGENEAVGSSTTSVQNVDQIADSVNTTDGEDEGDPIGDAFNTADQSVLTDGIGDVMTGEAIGSGNFSDTTIDQWATNDAIDVSSGEDGEGASTNQTADVINDGIGTATSGGNTATGNFSSSAQNSSQIATTVNTSTNASSSVGLGSNLGTARNRAYGSSRITTGGSTATGNSSTTTVVSSSYNSGIAVDS